MTTTGSEPEGGTKADYAGSGPPDWDWNSRGTVMTPDGKVKEVVAVGHRHPVPVPGTPTANEAISWLAVGKLGLVIGTAVPGPLGTAFSAVLAWQQWQSGDKTGAAVTAVLGLLNSVGIDASAGRVIFEMKETQAAAKVEKILDEEIKVPRSIGAAISNKSVHNINEFFDTLTGRVFKESSSRTSKVYQGQRVYKADKNIILQDGSKIRKGDQFYLDGLHKDHIEVFDANGQAKIKVDLAGNNLGNLPSGRNLP